MENKNLQYKNNFTSFGQNTVEFYDKHILLTYMYSAYFGQNLGWNHGILQYI